jgi:hypothetical protein
MLIFLYLLDNIYDVIITINKKDRPFITAGVDRVYFLI